MRFDCFAAVISVARMYAVALQLAAIFSRSTSPHRRTVALVVGGNRMRAAAASFWRRVRRCFDCLRLLVVGGLNATTQKFSRYSLRASSIEHDESKNLRQFNTLDRVVRSHVA